MSHIGHENDTISKNISLGTRLSLEGTHNEGPQVHPIIMEQKQYITGYPKATCSTADSNCSVSVGVDLEDGIWSYPKHCYIHSRHYC